MEPARVSTGSLSKISLSPSLPPGLRTGGGSAVGLQRIFERFRVNSGAGDRSSPCLGMLLHPSLHPPDHLVKRNMQHVSDLPQPDYRGIQNAPLDAADVGSIEAAPRRQLFLRDAGLVAAIAYGSADRSLLEAGRPYVASASLHAEISWWYCESDKPTAYTPHLRCRSQR